MMPHHSYKIDEFIALRGRPVYASDGEKLGDFEELYLDEATGEPEWIKVKSSVMGGILGSKNFLVPVAEAQFQNGNDPAIQVPYSKDQVQNAPTADGDWIPEETERQLYAHYGLQASERRSETQLPEGEFAGGEMREHYQHPTTPRGEVSMSRYEEELQVGKREVEAGRVRLRKWVETEPVTEQVELRRESAFIEREPVNRPASGAEIGEEEAEMRLHREEPVVSKETVERERITARPEEETEEETVHGEVRRERVEVEDDSDNYHERHR